MGNFFKIRVTVAIMDVTGNIRLVTKELYITVGAFYRPNIWEYVFELKRNERFKIVSFRFLTIYYAEEDKYFSPIGLDKQYYFQNELLSCSHKILAEETLLDKIPDIINHYRLQVCVLGFSIYDEPEFFERNILLSSLNMMFDLLKDLPHIRILGIQVLDQYYIDTHNIAGGFCSEMDEVPLDDFLMALENDEGHNEQDAIVWANNINETLGLTTYRKWFDLNSAPTLKMFMESDELRLLEREIKLTGLLN